MAWKSPQQKISPTTWEKWDKQFVWHPFTPQSLWEKDPMLVIDSGKGIYIKDVRGRQYIDGVSSLWVTLFGHRHPTLDRALQKQSRKIAHSTFLGLSHPEAILLARRLTQLAPKGLSRVFYSDNGSTSVEVALKMAYQFWDQNRSGRRLPSRSEFLALEGSYHGDTLGSVSVGGIGLFHKKFRPLLFKSHFAMAPQCFRCPFNSKKANSRFRCGEKVSMWAARDNSALRRDAGGNAWDVLNPF